MKELIMKLGTAVVTGASSGIGEIYADRLAKRGYDIVLVARSADKLAALAARLEKETGRKVRAFAADLSRREDVVRVEDLLRSDASISLLVNNAGVGAVNPLLETDVESLDSLLAVNISALTRLTYAAAPRFVERGGGTIINIASVVALAPDMLNGVYGGSKAYVLALTQSLHTELASKGVRVQAVLPGATATNLWESAGRPLSALPPAIVMSTEDMVDASLVGLDNGELVTIPALPDELVGEWTKLEAARTALRGNLSRSTPGARYQRA